MHKFETTLGRRDFLRRGLLGIAGLVFCEPLVGSLAWAAPLVRETSISLKDPVWVRNAIKLLWKERRRSGVTPLMRLIPPFNNKLCLYLKNEGLSPTGSLKHRVAWGLIIQALINGKIGPNTHLYERTSGNTGIGEAYFARLLGLPFTAVMRSGISPLKIQAIKDYGGNTAIAPAGVSPATHLAELLARTPDAYNLNQFADTEKSLDFFDASPDRSMNLANEVYRQLDRHSSPCPTWFVAGAGSGGTATSIARYLRKWAYMNGFPHPARLAVVDPQNSVLFDWYRTGDDSLTISKGSRIEGIGSSGPVIFGKTFSLLRTGVARMFKVPDDASVAAMRLTGELTGYEPGPSTGTNLVGAMRLLAEMHRKKEEGAIVTIICDDGKRYRDSYYDAQWLQGQGLNPERWRKPLATFWKTGRWTEPEGA